MDNMTQDKTMDNMTHDKCERAVEILREQGFEATHVQEAPGDHGVWLECVWNDALQQSYSFRLHDEEIEYYSSESKT